MVDEEREQGQAQGQGTPHFLGFLPQPVGVTARPSAGQVTGVRPKAGAARRPWQPLRGRKGEWETKAGGGLAPGGGEEK